ncbi:unnamed protein product [Musa textilis]
MDMERKQSELIDHFVKEATALDAAAPLADLILEATAHPSLFAFSEILSVPNLAKLKGTQYASSLYVLRLFACGTWSDYKCKRNAGSLPVLVPDQVRKLKQLTVLTLAETEKVLVTYKLVVLPYDQLMEELDVSNVRELEDFLINECMYAGIVRGKLDQLRRCFEVQFAAGRDLRPEQLDNMIQTLSDCLRLPNFFVHSIRLHLGDISCRLGTSDGLLHLIQEKIKWADIMSETNKKHKKEIEDKVEEVKKSLKADLDLRGHEESFSESGGMMDYEEDRVRPKR